MKRIFIFMLTGLSFSCDRSAIESATNLNDHLTGRVTFTDGPAMVTVVKENGVWKLKRNGQNYIVKGAASRADMLLNGMKAEDAVVLAPESTNQATVTASDPDGDPLEYEWVIAPEGVGGTDGGPHPGLPGWIQSQNGANMTFTAAQTGQYRLYVYVKDDHNKAASAGVPFLVE